MQILQTPKLDDMHAPGAQVPRPSSGHSAPTRVLSGAAFRPGPVAPLAALHKTAWKKSRVELFEPNFGEAYTRAVLRRMLGDGRTHRAPLVPSFGTDSRLVTEYCLDAKEQRRHRDRQLSRVMLLFGLPFLPGTVLWLVVFQVRKLISRMADARYRALLWVLTTVLALLACYLLLLSPPGPTPVRWYFRLLLVGPVVGALVARRFCVRSAKELTDKCLSVMRGSTSGPTLSVAVPRGPEDHKRERRRNGLSKIVEEQDTNLLFYAGSKGILGAGPRWGVWSMAEELVPQPGSGIEPFRSWDLVRAIRSRVEQLQQGVLNTGGLTKPHVDDWVVHPVGASATKLNPWYEAQWTGKQLDERLEGYRVRGATVTDICNSQHFDGGPRHYLSIQFPIWGGQLLLSMLVAVNVLHTTLRVEVTGHILGPVHGVLSDEPAPEETTRPRGMRFWEEEVVQLPEVTADEVVRMCVRAPFYKMPRVLDWLGGRLVLPEPFGLRSAWATKPWGNRFMADDALRAVSPVVRAVHNATLQMLDERGVDTSRFATRSIFLSGAAQSATPEKADEYSV